MSTWTEEEKKIVYSLLEEEKFYREIGDELLERTGTWRTPEAIRSMLKREKQRTKAKKKIRKDLAEPKTKEQSMSYMDALKSVEEIRDNAIDGMTEWTQHIGNPDKADFKVLSYSDQHIPFHHDGVLEHMLERESDADVLVLNGDFLELYSVSAWPKNKAVILKHEYELGLKMLKMLSDIFPKVVLVRGNHEQRLQSYFSAHLDPNVSFMTDPDILYRLANGYDFNKKGYLEKKYDFDNVVYNRGPLSWWVKIGKCIFAHPSGGSGIPMRTCINAATYFKNRDDDYEALVIGHSHQIGSIIWNNKLLIEQGCSCVPLEYEATSKMKYRPQSFGYATIFMNKEGHVDFEKSRPIYYGTGSIVEPDNYMMPE